MNVAMALTTWCVVGIFARSVDAASAIKRSSFLGGHKVGSGSRLESDDTLARLFADPGNETQQGSETLARYPNGWEKFLGHENPAYYGKSTCGATYRVDSSDNPREKCPKDCPLYVQNKMDNNMCSYACVRADECTKFNPDASIADIEKGVCREPVVNSCRKADIAGGTDTCIECEAHFHLGADGQCHFYYITLLWGVAVIAAIVGIIVVIWLIDCLFFRANSNEKNLLAALRLRSRQKLHDKHGALYQYATNLQNTMVAGGGTLLFFNFHAMIIVWALLVGAGWIFVGFYFDTDLFAVGNQDFGTPRENCIVVMWGYASQQRLMGIKVGYLAAVYVLTTVGCLIFSIRQLRRHQYHDGPLKLTKDFAAVLCGLPKVEEEASKTIEIDLKTAVVEATGKEVVGVSVCWDYSSDYIEVDEEVHFLQFEKQTISPSARGGPPPAMSSSVEMERYTSDMNMFRRQCMKLESRALCASNNDEHETHEERKARISALIQRTSNSDHAFVVFETERMRDESIERFGSDSNGFLFRGERIFMKQPVSNPSTVFWANFDRASSFDHAKRLAFGLGAILMGLALWVLIFYGPYAYYMLTFDYSNGRMPGFAWNLGFTIIVLIGNVTMYTICATVADSVGMQFAGHREAMYTILYTFACGLNILLDMVTTYYIAYRITASLGFRTHEGQPLQEVDDFLDRIQSYAMQRLMGQNIFEYAFPSCFLVGYLCEPIATILVPYLFTSTVVQSHPDINLYQAEELMASTPMDMGRYGDLLLNVFLAILIFFCPGAYTHSIFLLLGLSHIYIYAFDHWRVLRSVPRFWIDSMVVDWFAQAMLVPACGLILAALLFKGNCRGYGWCGDDTGTVTLIAGGFAIHCVVHMLLLVYVVPMFGVETDNGDPDIPWAEFTKHLPDTWFTCNPFHCLRSTYLHGHSPPCMWYHPGKEHLQESNPSIGIHYQHRQIEVEEFNTVKNISGVLHRASHHDQDKEA